MYLAKPLAEYYGVSILPQKLYETRGKSECPRFFKNDILHKTIEEPPKCNVLYRITNLNALPITTRRMALKGVCAIINKTNSYRQGPVYLIIK